MLLQPIRRLAGVAMLAGIAALGFSPQAHADYKLFVSDGAGDTVTVNGTTGVIMTTGTVSGVVAVTTPLGHLHLDAVINGVHITSTTGSSKPILGSPAAPEMDLTTSVTKTGGPASTLTFSLTDTGFGSGPTNTFLATFGGTNNGSTSTLRASVDGTNTEFGAPAASSLTLGPFSGASFAQTLGTTFPTVPNPYSMTLTTTVALVAGAASQSSDGHILSAAPEPGTVALALSGLPVLGLLWARRRRLSA
jgi:uncharacterized protein (TIGR03382 family)